MRIVFHTLPHEHVHPLKGKDVKSAIRRVLPSGIVVRKIVFGFNKRTTQEGRVTFDRDANNIDIRVNFCPYRIAGNSLASPLLATRKRFVMDVEHFGGRIDRERNIVVWDDNGAQGYTLFLLLHELAHALYARMHQLNLADVTGSAREERWCDDFARSNASKYISDFNG